MIQFKIGLNFLLLSLGCQTVLSQTDYFFPLKNELKWKDIELEDRNCKEAFIKQMYRGDLGVTYHLDTHCIHVLNLNNDQRNDIVYCGITKEKTLVFIQTASRFQLIFSENASIMKLDFSDQKISKMYLLKRNDGKDLLSKKVYEFNPNLKIPVFSLITNFHSSKHTVLPDSYLDKPLDIIIALNSGLLRESPKIVKKPYGVRNKFPVDTALLYLPPKTKAKAIAQYLDSRGCLWWFVVVPMDAKIQKISKAPYTKVIHFRSGWVMEKEINLGK